MSKTTAFLLSCLIYFVFIFSFVFLANFFMKDNTTINYGNSDINILFVKDESEEENEIKQDYTKEVANKANESIVNKDDESTSKEEIKKDVTIPNESNIDDLFGDLDIDEPMKKPEKLKYKTLTKEQFEQLKELQEKFANTTVKSNNNSKNVKTSAKTSGVYDEYFGRVNAYLKNKWSLVTANASGINPKEFFEISFKISKSGIISISDYAFSENTILRQKAKIFITLVNEENKNLGIPPGHKEYNGKLRLSVILNVKEIK